MKKVIATIAAIVLAAGAAFAQDLAQATEIFNAGAAALEEGDKAASLAKFNEALTMATELGEEGQAVVDQCKAIIPKVSLSMAKDLVKAGDYDAALTNLEVVSMLAEKYDAFEVLGEASDLIPQVMKSKAASLLKAKDYTGAIEAYKKVLEADPTDGVSALRLGSALNAAGNTEEAIAAFEQAAANGQEAQAGKQIGTIYLKKSSTLLKEKKYADAVEAAQKAYDYSSNAQALQIAGQASQLAGKNADAIKYFTQYLEAAPDAKNAGTIAYTVGALYQGQKNNAKAKEYYQKAVDDPKMGAEAKKMIDALK